MKYSEFPPKYLTFLVLTLMLSCSDAPEKTEYGEAFVLSEKMMSTTTTAQAGLMPLRQELNFYGRIAADNNKMIEVYPVVGGYVSKVYVELGDFVQRDQLLATIRSTEVAGYDKELEDARTDHLVALNNLKVAQELYAGKLNSERDVLEAKSILDKAESQLRRIEETYRIYSIRPGAIYEVRSPMSGFIIQKAINQDMLLRNDRSDNIFDIADIREVWAIANVNEADINRVKMGVRAEVTTLSYPDQVFPGKVDRIFNIIDPETRAMRVLIRLDNPDYQLKPEMRASIFISYEEEEQMIAVPSSAIIFDRSKYFVMVFAGRAHIETRQVEVHRQVGETAFIRHGLEEGEAVMTSNALLVYDALND